MLASSHFGIARTEADEWFDPILDRDTELFVDPFLVFKEASDPWSTAHDEIVAHFNRAFPSRRSRVRPPSRASGKAP